MPVVARLYRLVLVALLTLWLSSPPPAYFAEVAPADAALEVALRRHIGYLASTELAGRLPGTPGADKAAQYITSHFRRAGLRPLGEKGYWQPFPFIAKVRLGRRNALTATIGATRLTAKADADFRPLAFSANGATEGEVVFAGYGIAAAKDAQYDDYAGLDVKGRIVLTLPYSPAGSNPHTKFGPFLSLRYKATTARNQGAAALIVIAEDDDFSRAQVARLRYDDAFGDAGFPCAVVSRAFAAKLLGTPVADLEKAIAASGQPASRTLPNVRLALQTELVKERQTGFNIIGFLEGGDPTLREEVIVVGAHYDHLGLGGPNSLAPREGDVHPGADDNASGTAGLIELAQAFGRRMARPKRSLLFIAFSAEEKGLIGSAYFVDHPTTRGKRIVAMVNMDMIGRLRDNRLTVQGVGTSSVWRPLLTEANQRHGFDLSLGESGFGPSDHASFYKRNIPVLFFFTGSHPDYHRPSDTADKINYAGERRVLGLIGDVIRTAANLPTPPDFIAPKASEPAERARGSFRVSLGTIPDYAAEIAGVKLAGVREGSPAAKVGLQAGDVIVGLAGRDIKSVYDYTYVLQELEPEQEVEVIVLRGAQRLTFKLVTARR
ncbi:MAG: M20/M25/M40 family metallo-hydrolase [Chloracidobacterium sp.]|nr:M20/M25/M40 family metallo-hydrolase [Chloracidobacterium sp.]MDW8217602.1 M20/M25/M40 family metallo-hydrolase [Acidobacteriota bacterium]